MGFLCTCWLWRLSCSFRTGTYAPWFSMGPLVRYVLLAPSSCDSPSDLIVYSIRLPSPACRLQSALCCLSIPSFPPHKHPAARVCSAKLVFAFKERKPQRSRVNPLKGIAEMEGRRRRRDFFISIPFCDGPARVHPAPLATAAAPAGVSWLILLM